MNILWQFVKSGQFNAVLCGIIWALAFPNYEIAALAYIVPGYLLIVVQNNGVSPIELRKDEEIASVWIFTS